MSFGPPAFGEGTRPELKKVSGRIIAKPIAAIVSGKVGDQAKRGYHDAREL
jgi:hypothetical protein